MRALVLILFAGGCFHTVDDDIIEREPPDLSVRSYDFATTPIGDGGLPGSLGSERARPAASTAIHVGANQSVTVPEGKFGFTVTANGRGGWRVAWVDAAQLGYRFHASVFSDGAMSALSSTAMRYATLDGSGTRLDFESLPGAGELGWVDFSAGGAITVDGLVGASPGTLYYPSSAGVTLSASTPASFVSP